MDRNRLWVLRGFLAAFLIGIWAGAAFAVVVDPNERAIYLSAVDNEESRNFEAAKTKYRELIAQFPNGVYAPTARLCIAKVDIVAAIEGGLDANEIRLQINSFLIEFAGHEDIAKGLYDFARRCENVRKFGLAAELYKQASETLPANDYTEAAKICAAYAGILDLIESGKDTQADIDKFLVDFADNPRFQNTLYHIAERYQNSPKPDYAKAGSLYQKIIADYPSTEWAARAQIYLAAASALTMIDSLASEPNQSEVVDRINAEITRLTADYAASAKFYTVILAVAERVYAKGLAQVHQEPNRVNVFFNLSRDIAQNRIAGKTDDKSIETQAYYIAGLDGEELGDFASAAQAFQNAYQTNPLFQFADYCLFAQGNCYEKLKAAGKIDANEADVVIENAYQAFLTKYPDHSIVDHVALRLAELNMERHRYATAYAYLEWFLMYGTSRDMACRTADVNRMIEKYGRTTGE
jgi:outer membrane protein assembly factor BamD (BamD/ComL family)